MILVKQYLLEAPEEAPLASFSMSIFLILPASSTSILTSCPHLCTSFCLPFGDSWSELSLSFAFSCLSQILFRQTSQPLKDRHCFRGWILVRPITAYSGAQPHPLYSKSIFREFCDDSYLEPLHYLSQIFYYFWPFSSFFFAFRAENYQTEDSLRQCPDYLTL